MNTAVLFMIFNRPDLTEQSFASIRKAAPPRLYIAADGPRADRPHDAGLCEQTRRIATLVDWPCEVKTLFRKRNLGCKVACTSAISWFFQQEEEGIILEDDCVAHPDFFPYCENLLERYRDEPRVMHIAGSNFEYGKKRGGASYFFSIFPHIWGWATWARAWRHYDVHMHGMEGYIKSRMPAKVGHHGAFRMMMRKLMLIHEGLDNGWDYQLVYAIWRNNGLCVIPNANMIRNIGYVEDAAHPCPPDVRTVRPLEGMPALTHPEGLTPDDAAHLFACETLAAEGPALYPALLREGARRLAEGDHEANRKLLAIAGDFYGPREELLSLEIVNALAAGNTPQAERAVAKLREVCPESELLVHAERRIKPPR